MREEIFNACFDEWKLDRKNVKYWKELGKRFDTDPEVLRGQFKRERKRRGIVRDENRNIEKVNLPVPKIGIFDIETLPMETYCWGLFDQNIGLEQIISDTGFLSWAGKFLNEPDIYSDILTSKEAPSKDSKRITKSCWEFLSKCDAIVGHNALSFDVKIMNTFFLKHNLPPLKYVTIDTLLIARNNFRFDSNKMKFINQKLNIKQKVDNSGFSLWRDCHKGIQSALDSMLEYNIGDVYATEELYYILRPYIKNFNVALYNNIDSYQCPNCGGTDLKKMEHLYPTSAGLWESVRCETCKGVYRKKTNLLDKEKKKSLLINS